MVWVLGVVFCDFRLTHCSPLLTRPLNTRITPPQASKPKKATKPKKASKPKKATKPKAKKVHPVSRACNSLSAKPRVLTRPTPHPPTQATKPKAAKKTAPKKAAPKKKSAPKKKAAAKKK